MVKRLRTNNKIKKSWIIYTQGCYLPILDENGRRRFLNVFLLFTNYLALEKGVVLNKVESPSPKNALCQV